MTTDTQNRPEMQEPSEIIARAIAHRWMTAEGTPYNPERPAEWGGFAQDILRALTAAGYVVVPREPDARMIYNGSEALAAATMDSGPRGAYSVIVWRAMIDAFLAGCGR